MAQLGRAHDLLRHHKIVSLRAVNALLRLDAANTELVLHANAHLTDRANSADGSREVVAVTILLQITRPVLVLCRDLGRVALHPNHASADTDDLVLIDNLAEVLISLHVVPLVGQATHHHVGRLASRALCHDAALHDDVVLLDDGHVAIVTVVLARVATCVLLRLDVLTTQHLWVLDFYVRVVQDEVIVIHVLDDLDRLLVRVAALLLGL